MQTCPHHHDADQVIRVQMEKAPITVLFSIKRVVQHLHEGRSRRKYPQRVRKLLKFTKDEIPLDAMAYILRGTRGLFQSNIKRLFYFT